MKRADTSLPPDGDLNQQRVMYYFAPGTWQLLEERIDDGWSVQSSPGDDDRTMAVEINMDAIGGSRVL